MCTPTRLEESLPHGCMVSTSLAATEAVAEEGPGSWELDDRSPRLGCGVLASKKSFADAGACYYHSVSTRQLGLARLTVFTDREVRLRAGF